MNTKKSVTVKFVTKIAVLSALSAVLMLFQIPVWFAPSFYEIDLSDAVVLMGGFALGPWAAVLIELFKNLLNLLLNGTMTAGVGEFANFIMGCSLAVPAALVYRKHKSLKGAIVGLLIGILSLAVVSCTVNYFVMIPAYVYFMGFSVEAIVSMASAVNPLVGSFPAMILFATLPFNLLKGIVCAFVNILLYKRVSKILHI